MGACVACVASCRFRRLAQLAADLQIPRLVEHGIEEADFPDIITKARNASSMKANPVDLDDAELTAILQAAL